MAVSLPPNKKRIDYGCLDRLSNLPKEVINEILECMPINDAVKTSMLSTSWRYRWMSMSKLIFHSHSIPSSVEDGRTNADLVNYITNILLLHNGMISTFEVDNFLESGCSDIDRWILVLSRKMLKCLVLVFDEHNSYQVPSCLFACGNLRELTLQGCSLSLPSHYKGFSYLRLLVLKNVKLTTETLESLVVKCTSLLGLTVWFCTSLSHLRIHAPKLRQCCIVGAYDGITFQNAPELKSADILLWQGTDFKPTCKLNEVLRGVVEIRRLNFFYPFMEVDAAQRLQTTCHGLKVLKLQVNLEDSKQILAILCLCRSAPNLEKIVINACWDRSVVLLFEEHFWEGQVCKDQDILHHLKTVSMTKFKGVPHELVFVEFILLNALARETLNIEWEEGVQIDKELLHILVNPLKQMSCSLAYHRVLQSRTCILLQRLTNMALEDCRHPANFGL